MRKFITVAGCALAAIAPPTVAAAGGGAFHFPDSWYDDHALHYAGDWCGTGETLAGYGVDAGTANITVTPNGGTHIVAEVESSVPLYEASGPPWAVVLGDYVGTFTSSGTGREEDAPAGQAAIGGSSQGVMAYADGTAQKIQTNWHFVAGQDGSPKVFFSHTECGPIK
jgi:hypothetical protein